MKKRMFVAFMACIAVMFASCNKEKELNGTSWKTHTTVSQNVIEDGVSAHVDATMDATIKFTSATTGVFSMTTSGVVTSMGMQFPLEETVGPENFTYTFNGNKGRLTFIERDGETETVPFTYNKQNNTILIIDREDDADEISIELVFTEE